MGGEPAGLAFVGAAKPTRLAGEQTIERCWAESSGLSQLIVVVLPMKAPDGAIWATERSSMNIASMYGCSALLIS